MYRDTVFRVYSKISLTCTNVPGPQETVVVAGCQVKSCIFFVNHLHPVFSMLSYNGQIHAALAVDDTAIHNVHLLPSFFMRALVLLGNEMKIDVPESILKESELKN